MTIAMATAPNSAVPVGLRKKIAADVGLDAPKHAAGIVFVAPDGDILLLRRSSKEANFSGHWALPGGGVDDGETPAQGAQREAKEEMGVDVDSATMKPLDRRVTPTGTTFHTFASATKDKFVPQLNDEHSGYAWASLDQLPGPMHPAVEQTLKEQIGVGAEDADPASVRDGFIKFAAGESKQAADAALILALDEGTVRTYDTKGHLHVSIANISKATVSPYRGKEIPNSEALGLDPNRIYNLYRDPAELEKGSATFNAIQILIKHTPVNAADHKPHETVGATGTDAHFAFPYLKNSLVVWAKDAIDAIDNDDKKELSCGYNYRADMTPGNIDGMRYDGVMRDIVGNHVALVKDGRAGPDVVVGDSRENLDMKPTKFAVLALRHTAATLAPLMAMDAKIELPNSLFKDLSLKNYAEKRKPLFDAIKAATAGKLASGKMAEDADIEGLVTLLDAIGGKKEGMDDAAPESDLASMTEPMTAVTAPTQPAADEGAEGLKKFLGEKGMAQDDIDKACGFMAKKQGADESPEEKEAREKKEKEKAAADADIADKAKKELEAKDAAMKDMVSKPAMDEAIKSAVGAARKEEQAIREAVAFVRPWVGELSPTMALDSAEGVYRHVAESLGLPNAKTIHGSALRTMIELMPKPGARPVETGREHMAMDSAQTKSFAERFPDAGRISHT